MHSQTPSRPFRPTPSPLTTVTFGCVPHTDDDRTRTHLAALCGWLSTELGALVRPHRAPSPEALASAFGASRVDIAWVSPALLITSPYLAEAKPVVCSIRQGVASYHSVLFVEERSPYRSPSDLGGARAAWVARTSAAGYIVPRLALASHGLDPRTVFSSETFHDSHGNVARAVLSGHADVGATFAVFENGDPTHALVGAGYIDAPVHSKRARILYAAGPIPSDPIVIGRRIAPTLWVSLIRAFENVASHPSAIASIKHILGADAFEAVKPRAFDTLREQIRDGRALGLLDD